MSKVRIFEGYNLFSITRILKDLFFFEAIMLGFVPKDKNKVWFCWVRAYTWSFDRLAGKLYEF